MVTNNLNSQRNKYLTVFNTKADGFRLFFCLYKEENKNLHIS